jgi:hypothetical protein
MIKLEKERYDSLHELYESSEIFFPLIASVLLDEQDGVVYVDDTDSPSQAYVEHAFGFAQIFGTPIESFEQELQRYLLVDKLFLPDKVRLYAPYLPSFLESPKYEPLRSFRQRFHISPENISHDQNNPTEPAHGLNLCGVNTINVSLIDSKFGVVNRFWRTPDDFIKKSNATVVLYEDVPASICYSAAEADHRVEIDVMTLPEYRNRGLARHAVMEFVKRCFSLSLRPLWDCFTNNAGSMMLCRSIGFTAAKAPYPFFTISRLSSGTDG